MNPSNFKQQKELDEVAEQVADLEEQIELLGDDEPQGYVPEKGTEHLIHVRITRGKKFDENTGKEISKPYVQMFTYVEFKNFKEKADLIGYSIDEILYNPYKDQ